MIINVLNDDDFLYEIDEVVSVEICNHLGDRFTFTRHQIKDIYMEKVKA